MNGRCHSMKPSDALERIGPSPFPPHRIQAPPVVEVGGPLVEPLEPGLGELGPAVSLDLL